MALTKGGMASKMRDSKQRGGPAKHELSDNFVYNEYKKYGD